MNCLNYRENIKKLIGAKNSQVESMLITIRATIKFLSSREKFWENNLNLIKEISQSFNDFEDFSPSFAKDIQFLLSTEINDPVGYAEICTFLELSFVPFLREICAMYENTFDEEYKNLQPYIEKLDKSEEDMFLQEEIYKKTCNELETLKNSPDGKNQEEKFNDLAFDYKSLRQKTIFSVKEYNEAAEEFMSKCDAFFAKFEFLDRNRSEQMHSIFEALETLIKRIFFKEDQIGSLENRVKESKLEKESINIEGRITETQLPKDMPVVDLDFSYSEFLDTESIFSSALKQKFAIAKEDIKKSKTVIAKAGEKIVVRSINEDIALIANLDDSLRLAVSLDLLDIRPEFDRYLATVKNGPYAGHVVCVIYKGEECEVINELGEIEKINLSDLS